MEEITIDFEDLDFLSQEEAKKIRIDYVDKNGDSYSKTLHELEEDEPNDIEYTEVVTKIIQKVKEDFIEFFVIHDEVTSKLIINF